MTVHTPSYLMIRGHISLYCSCGWNGGRHRNSSQAHTAWQLHADDISRPMLGTTHHPTKKEDNMSDVEQPVPPLQPVPAPTPDTDDDEDDT